MMVQGNLAAITVGHFVKAFTTGGATAIAMIVLSFFSPNKDFYKNKYLLAGLTGFVTMVVDLMVHPSHFGGEHTEAIVTGIAAGALALIMGKFWKK
jgi:hypothetical protein